MIINEEKLIIFSDFHWGKNKDSELKVAGNEQFIDWLIAKCNTKGVKNLIFMGDWHENRNSLSVKTFNKSYESIKKISEAGITLYMLVGNHDSYFKDNIETNSLVTFNDLPGIHVITVPTDIEFMGSKGVMVPWDTYDDIKGKYDVMFGHFEFAGGSFNNVMTCKHGISGSKLTTIAPLVFSGHFHLRKEYPYKHGKIVTVGCPLQLDWGDYGDDKGIYLLNSDLSYEFIHNDVSSNYVKIKVSDIINGSYKFDNIENNYVSLVVDRNLEFDKIIDILSVIDSKKPLIPCETEYTAITSVNGLVNSSDDVMPDSISKSKMDQLSEYITNLDETEHAHVEGLDVGTLTTMIMEYYKEFEDVSE
jgi:DNA repair exonuclease SbcCD nuclease subunit